MSDSTSVVLNQQVNIGADRRKLLYVSGTQKTYQNPANNGSILGGQILFSNVALPSLANSCISRNMRVRYRVQITATGSLGMINYSEELGGSNIGYQALRPFPLSACTDTAILTINNVPVALNLRQALPSIMRTIPKEYLQKQASECPSMLDTASLLVVDTVVNVLSPSNQPLSSMFNCVDSQTRGSFAPVFAGSDYLSYTYEVCEPIFVAPLSLHDDQTFLFNVNTLSYQINYSLLNDMCVRGQIFGGGTSPYPAGYTVSLVDNSARLEYEVISVDSRLVSVPRVVSYPYALPQWFPTPIPAFANPLSAAAIQNTGTVQSQSLRLSYMPSLIYVYASVPVNTRAAAAVAGQPAYPDCNLALGSASGTTGAAGAALYNTDQTNVLSIQLNNRQGLAQGASIKDLFRMAVRNGYPYSYNTWLQNPIMIINPVSDLGIDISQSDIYADQNGNVTLQLQCSFNTWNYSTNSYLISAAATAGWATLQTTQLSVVCVQSGICEISPDTMVINTGPISATEAKVAISQAAEGNEESYVPSAVAKGAGLPELFGNAKNVISSVAKGIGSVVDDPLFRAALDKAKTLKGGSESAGRLRKR